MFETASEVLISFKNKNLFNTIRDSVKILKKSRKSILRPTLLTFNSSFWQADKE